MTSIFNSYYGQNLLRLNSSLKGESSEKKTHSGNSAKAENFAKVLADLENPRQPSRISAQGEPTNDTPPPLTNFTLEELQENTREESTSKKDSLKAISSNRGPTELQGASYFNVNFPASTAKPQISEIIASPVPAPSAPAAPKLVEITREDFVKPSTPKLASVERIGVPEEKQEVVLSHREAMKDIIKTAGKFYGIDPNLSMAVAQVESAFEPEAVSKDGHASKGIFQLLDTTGRHMMDHTGVENEDYDPFDPAQNAYLGVGYLRRLHDIFSAETHLGGNMKTVPARSAEQLEKLAVAAFNTGEGNVARAQARARSSGKDPADFSSIEPYLPASTRRYVQKVSQLRQAFAADEDGTETA